MMKNIFLYLFIFSIFTNINSRNNENEKKQINSKPTSSFGNRALGDCVTGKSQIELDVNNVRAKLLNTGDMWWDREVGKYGVPKLTAAQDLAGKKQPNALYAGAIWVSGKDGTNLKIAAVRYSSTGTDFYPGPLFDTASTDISISKSTCAKFDQFFGCKKEDFDELFSTNNITNNIKYWPGKGNVELLKKGFTEEELSVNLAPFYDSDADGIYNADAGDYPAIKYTTDPSKIAIADQMIFYVINDLGNTHGGASGSYIGVQLNCLAFAFSTSDEINNMTFYTYEIINRGASLTETYVSQYVDCDLGNHADDMVGCDIQSSMGYVYNSDAFDEDNGLAVGYQSNVPILGVDFFEGPKDDNGDQLGMSSFVYYVNQTGAPNSDPSTAIEHRSYQEGKTKQGGNFTASNDCITAGAPATKFCFSSNPFTNGGFSMCDKYKAGDYRFLQNSGPFSLKTGEPQIVSIGVVFVQPPANTYQGCKIDVNYWLSSADNKAQELFNNGFKTVDGPNAPKVNVIEEDNTIYLSLYNEPTSNNFGEKFDIYKVPIPKNPGNVSDTTYTFEGYVVYQVEDPANISTISDLFDNTKAKMITTMDKVNDVKGLVYNRVDFPGSNVKTIDKSLDLKNEGINYNLKIEKDLFASEGISNIVNQKSYYFAVIAFAHNNFKNFIPSTNSFEYQEEQIFFSNNITIVSAIPHNNSIYGYKPNSTYFQKVPLKRINGVGAGSYFLDIDSADEMNIVENLEVQEFKYKAGKSPLDVQIIDPYKLKAGTYSILLTDTNSNATDNYNLNSTYWTVETNIDGNNYVIESERNLDRDFGQELFYTDANDKRTSTGLMISNSLASQIGTNKNTNNLTYAPQNSTVEYSGSKWLEFLKNEVSKDYKNWIMTGGKYNSTPADIRFNSSFNNIGNIRHFTDSNSLHANHFDGQLAPYCLTNNYSCNAPSSTADAIYYSNSPGFKWKSLNTNFDKFGDFNDGHIAPVNNLDSLNNVDLVITNDKAKWSKCIVLETGESPKFNSNNTIKGQIRKESSLDENGEPSGDGEGLSYFPGYAIDLETGKRLCVFFGENSSKEGKYAANMIWDPNKDTISVLNEPGLGGNHFVYVTNIPYNETNINDLRDIMINNFNKDINNVDINYKDLSSSTKNIKLNSNIANIYKSFMWTFVPILNSNFEMYNSSNEYSIPSDLRIKFRVNSPYNKSNGEDSKYEFTITDDMVAKADKSLTENAILDQMYLVPNPYNAFSFYEQNEAQNIVKIVNIPNKCTIKIFTLDGVLIRTINRSLENYNNNRYGNETKSKDVNLDNSLNWDMKTTSGVLIASGVYFINVETPNVGTKVMKLFATMRSTDVSKF